MSSDKVERYVVLDTETTGLEHAQGHRVIEVAGVEILGRRVTGEHFHAYLNADRDSDPGALEKHGLTREFLSDKPKFKDVVDDLIAFIRGAKLIIHNASFDVGFLNHEFALAGRAPLDTICPPPIDSLLMAREFHPGKRNSLDALSERYGVDHSKRVYHGALLDSELLAEVYLAMTRGQDSLVMELAPVVLEDEPGAPRSKKPLVVSWPSPAELADHVHVLEGIDQASKGACVWLNTAGLKDA